MTQGENSCSLSPPLYFFPIILLPPEGTEDLAIMESMHSCIAVC